jgi:hypothetical protein
MAAIAPGITTKFKGRKQEGRGGHFLKYILLISHSKKDQKQMSQKTPP